VTPHRPYGRPRLIGLPYDASSSFLRGSAVAPPLIRAALHSPAWNSWAHSLRDVLGEHGLTDAGDLTLPPTEAARALIECGVGDLASAGFSSGWGRCRFSRPPLPPWSLPFRRRQPAQRHPKDLLRTRPTPS
jgi:hypothetical protein